jgi:hypothetical protein
MSVGGLAALAFGARRSGLAGIIALAPNGSPERLVRLLPQIAESVAQARAMVAADRGDEGAGFIDMNMRGSFSINTTAAIYLSFLIRPAPPTSPTTRAGCARRSYGSPAQRIVLRLGPADLLVMARGFRKSGRRYRRPMAPSTTEPPMKVPTNCRDHPPVGGAGVPPGGKSPRKGHASLRSTRRSTVRSWARSSSTGSAWRRRACRQGLDGRAARGVNYVTFAAALLNDNSAIAAGDGFRCMFQPLAWRRFP